MDKQLQEILENDVTLNQVSKGQETLWINPLKTDFQNALKDISLTKEQIKEAKDRLDRFAPFIMKAFEETIPHGGIIESPIKEIENMKNALSHTYDKKISGRLLLKMDSDLPIAGSIKARGGIYEILCHSEKLALKNGIITQNDDYSELCNHKEFFSKYAIHVGSTGNLGLSIGIMSAVIGYRVTVHMSQDAKEWKKKKLRSYGVNVVEYEGDFSMAVGLGREMAKTDPYGYFVDDENSLNLFMGYAVAGQRLKKQLNEMNITVDSDHPLFVYLPCGVGGAPGGVTFGLKHEFFDNVHCFFVEPTQCPSMLVGMATQRHDEISVHEIGLSGKTHADGLAVSRPSKLVGRVMDGLLSGDFTTEDYRIYDYMRMLNECENIFIEPSACAAFMGAINLENTEMGKKYLCKNGLLEKMDNATHIAWATGGMLVPQKEREEFLSTHLA